METPPEGLAKASPDSVLCRLWFTLLEWGGNAFLEFNNGEVVEEADVLSINEEEEEEKEDEEAEDMEEAEEEEEERERLLSRRSPSLFFTCSISSSSLEEIEDPLVDEEEDE